MNVKTIVLFALLMAVSTSVWAAPWTAANSNWNVNVLASGAVSNYYGQWPGHTYYPSPSDWRSIGIYQFITDRFRDGDPSNNEGRYGGYDLYSVGYRHGGDFRGVKDQLHYIKSLGYHAIWISPIFQNRYNSYHGYGQIDYTLLDERFGTLADLRDLTAAAHSNGMYVIADIVVNHMEDLFYFHTNWNSGAEFKFHTGEYNLHWRDTNTVYADFVISNEYFASGTYCDVYNDSGEKVVDSGSGSYWMSDFHHNGDLQNYGDVWQNHLGKIYGFYDDVRVTHPRVQDKIIAMTKALVASADIDGIRMDTPMQVPLYFFKRWCPAVKDYAATLGKSNFFIFGEFYCSRERAATMVGRGRDNLTRGNPFGFIDGTYAMDGGINYPMYNSFFQPAIKDQANGNLNQCSVQYGYDTNNVYDFYRPLAGETRYLMCNFFNNHDQWRMVHATGGDGFKKTDLAAAILTFWPGIALYYYGDEQGFCSAGTALDGWAREDMMTSKAWYDVHTFGYAPTNPAIVDNFNMCHPQFLHVQKCNAIKRRYPALRNTDELYERWCQGGAAAQNGVYAYSRIWGGASNYVLVVFNSWSSSLQAGGDMGDFWTGWSTGERIVNLFNTNETHILGLYGRLTNRIDLAGYETKVFVRSDNVQLLDPAVTNVSPSHDARVVGSSQSVILKFDQPMSFATLTNAFRFNGAKAAPGTLSYDSGTRALTYSASGLEDGIHFVELTEEAQTAAGRPLYAMFRSRFRKGGDLNPIANPQKDFMFDATLVNAGVSNTDYRTVALSHKAAGAEYLRVSPDGGASWTEWLDYDDETEVELDLSPAATNSIVVQYWADGSAAYYSWAPLYYSGVGGPTNLLVTPSTLSARYSAVSGGVYQLEYKTYMTNTTWTKVGSAVTATTDSVLLQDTGLSSISQRFYRTYFKKP